MMIGLFDEDFDAMELVEGALILNSAIDPQTDDVWSKRELKRLLADAERQLVHETHPQQRFEAFLRIFYHEWKFHGDDQVVFSSSNTYIDKVLQNRRGIPLSLGALLLYFGNKLGFPVKPVTFPTQFLLQLQWPDEEVQYVNPYSGEYVSRHTLESWLIGHFGPFEKLKAEHLRVTDHPTVIGRWLALMKSTLLREEHYVAALRCTDIALSFVPADPHEIRDRGFIYQQLECLRAAVLDYEYFIEHCPDDPAAKLLRNQVRLLSESQATVH